jgi:hypothetical protein
MHHKQRSFTGSHNKLANSVHGDPRSLPTSQPEPAYSLYVPLGRRTDKQTVGRSAPAAPPRSAPATPLVREQRCGPNGRLRMCYCQARAGIHTGTANKKTEATAAVSKRSMPAQSDPRPLNAAGMLPVPTQSVTHSSVRCLWRCTQSCRCTVSCRCTDMLAERPCSLLLSQHPPSVRAAV